MRQRDGSDLLGTNDPRSATIGVIHVAPEDDRQNVLAAIMTQAKLGRKQTVIVLPDPNKALNRTVDFDGLRDMRRNLQTRIVLVVPKDSDLAEFARQRRFPVFSSLEEYAQSLETTESAQGIGKKGWAFGRKQPPADTQTSTTEPTDKVEDEQTAPLPLATPEAEPTSTPGSPGPASNQLPPAASDEALQDSSIPLVPGLQEPDNPPVSPVTPVLPLPAVQPVAPSTPEEDAVQPDEQDTEGTLPTVPPFAPSVPSADPWIPNAATPGTPRKRRQGFILVALILLILLLGGGIAFVSIRGSGPLSTIFSGGASSAVVTITPASMDLKNSYTVFAVTSVPNVSQKQVGARLVSSTTPAQSKTVQVTGVGTIPAVQAQGLLSFYNALPIQQTVPAGTILTDAKGIKVVTDQTAVIQAAAPPLEGSVDVSARAVVAGVSGNIPALDFNSVSCCLTGVTVANPATFSGGQDLQHYPFVQQSDIDDATNALQTMLTQTAQKAVQAQVSPRERLASALQCTPDISSDHVAGDKTANVTVTVAVTCTGEVYDLQGTQSLAVGLLKIDASKSLSSGYALVGTIVTMVTKAQVIDTKGTVSLLVTAEGVWIYQFTSARKSELAKLIAGKSEDAAKALLLGQVGVKVVKFFSISGGDGMTLPGDPRKIRLVLQGVPGFQITATPTVVPSTPAAVPTSTPTPIAPTGTPGPTSTSVPTAVPTATPIASPPTG